MRFHLKKSITWLLGIGCFFILTINFYNRRLWLMTESGSRPWGKDFNNGRWINPVEQEIKVVTRRVHVENVTVAREQTTKSNGMPKIYPVSQIWQNLTYYDNDRITNQLKYQPEWLQKKLEADEKVNFKKIVLYQGFGSWAVKRGQTTFVEQKCLVNTCELTDQRSAAQDAAAVLFNHGPQRPWTTRPIDQIWVLFMLESPYHTPGLSAFPNIMNWTASYRHDSDIVAPYEKFVPFDQNIPYLPQNKSYAAGKTKKVAWFVSNCGARNTRREYANELGRHISVDIYGGCGTLKCPRRDSSCFEKLNKEYKFYLAFENSNCRDYITEKFFVNGLQHDVIPIVMGAAPSDYARAAPPHSFIHVDDFESPAQLAQYLHKLDKNDTLFNEYFRWKGTGSFINTFFWCRICTMLHDKSRVNHSYRNLERWWRGDGVCIGKENWRQRNLKTNVIIDDYL